jgi:hypothetical protein
MGRTEGAEFSKIFPKTAMLGIVLLSLIMLIFIFA